MSGKFKQFMLWDRVVVHLSIHAILVNVVRMRGIHA